MMLISKLTLFVCTTCAVSAFGPQRLKQRQSHLSSTAGQGGGVFYDGSQEFGSKTSSGESASPTSSSSRRQRRVQHKDCVIIGGGLAGLSAALYLSQLDPERDITILERESFVDPKKKETTVASFAAAGMLAPQSERLPKGPLLDLCMSSRRLYPDFVDLVESLAQDSDGQDHLWSRDDWSVGYMASGGFLAPAFAGDSVATWAPPEESGTATWLDSHQVRELEPHLHPDVVGGWWFPEDASVDARRLTCSLRAACVAAGVHLQGGTEVKSLDLVDGTCKGLWLESGKYLATKSVLVANGAWMRNLLPVPIEPHKGQSISLRMPDSSMLQRVLFAQDTYIVPKADGRVVVGATVEAGSYDPNVTPAGLMHIMQHACQLVPGLADLPLEETWVGLRPTTPDKGPILGKTPWDNLFLAGGYWRNGVLLAPKTGQLLATLLSDKHSLSSSDQELLDAFAWDRFTSPEGSATMVANTRYAASMHPIHRRKSGSGVAAAVGTELGAYSTARSATEERAKDRSALFDSTGDESLERAAELGRADAGAFIYEDDKKGKVSFEAAGVPRPSLPETTSLAEVPYFGEKESDIPVEDTVEQESKKYEGSPDAFTVHASQSDDDDDDDLSSIYQSIQENKQSRGSVEMGEAEKEDRPDPGFRIYHVDPDTRESREVPPYTSPDDFVKQLAAEKKAASQETVNGESGDSIFDGYKAIEDANADKSEEESAKAMREARIKNRGISEPLDLDEDSFPTFERPKEAAVKDEGAVKEKKVSLDNSTSTEDLSDIYNRIKENKQASVEMGDAPEDDRPLPNFTIYYVDPDTREGIAVPPFTSPEEMVRMVQESKKANATTIPSESSAISSESNSDEYSEQTFDGYQDIQQANARGSRQEELDAMRAARQRNRLGQEIDLADIGAQRPSDND